MFWETSARRRSITVHGMRDESLADLESHDESLADLESHDESLASGNEAEGDSE